MGMAIFYGRLGLEPPGPRGVREIPLVLVPFAQKRAKSNPRPSQDPQRPSQDLPRATQDPLGFNTFFSWGVICFIRFYLAYKGLRRKKTM